MAAERAGAVEKKLNVSLADANAATPKVRASPAQPAEGRVAEARVAERHTEWSEHAGDGRSAPRWRRLARIRPHPTLPFS